MPMPSSPCPAVAVDRPSLRPLHDFEEDDDDDDEAVIGSGLSVVSRQDVTHIGRALYQYAHLHGRDRVRKMPGLVPTGAATMVQAHDELLRGDPDGWPDELFTIDAPVLFGQSDVYG